MTRTYFGIGCFNYGLNLEPPFKIKYVEELEKALQALPNIENLNILISSKADALEVEIDEELPTIDQGEFSFMPVDISRIHLEIHLPQRVQEDILAPLDIRPETYTTTFVVDTIYSYHCPVSFVELVGCSAKPKPSNAVIILREFFKNNINGNQDNPILFECLGPSPFHVNCSIEEARIVDDSEVFDYECKKTMRRGYDEMSFLYDSRTYGSIAEAKEEIYHAVFDELGFYYRVIQQDVHNMRDWQRIEGWTSDLIKGQQTTGLKRIGNRLFKQWRLVNDIYTALIEFESDGFFLDHTTQRDYKDTYIDDSSACFKEYVDIIITERVKYPTESINALLNFFESRRAKSVELIILLFAGFIGGVIGSLITILAK